MCITISIWTFLFMCITCTVIGSCIAVFIVCSKELHKRQKLYKEGYHRGKAQGELDVKLKLLRLNKYCSSVTCKECMFKADQDHMCRIRHWSDSATLDTLFQMCDVLPIEGAGTAETDSNSKDK